MLEILALILIIGIIWLLVMMLRNAARFNPELFSMRNFFLAGLIVFQFTSGIIAFLTTDVSNPYLIANKERPALIYTLILVMFTITFLLIYRSGFIAKWIVDRVRRPDVYVTWPKLLVLSLAIFGVGLACRLFSDFIPYIGIYTYMFGAAFLALATGLAAWAWAPRMWNPVPLAVMAVVVLGGLGVLFTDSFGRRDMVGILIAFLWGAYYSHWRYGSFRTLVFHSMAISAVTLLFLAAYTSTRYSFGTEIASLEARVKALATGDLKQGVIDVFSGQAAGDNSLYFIATRPESFEYDTLHSLKLFFAFPVPRAMWPSKPDALGITSVDEINNARKPAAWNIGPGLVGHMANDNPYLAFPLYTIILAVFIRLCDGLISKFAHDPFVVLPMGVALGQVIALPRGELANFFAKTVLYLIGCWVIMQIVSRVVRMISPSSSMLSSSEDDWSGNEAEDTRYASYEESGV